MNSRRPNIRSRCLQCSAVVVVWEQDSVGTIDLMGREEKCDAGIDVLLDLFTGWRGFRSQPCSLDDLSLQQS